MKLEYDTRAHTELRHWQQQMSQPPGLFNRATSGIQRKLNSYIPESVHTGITAVMKQMTRAVITGSDFTATDPLREGTLQAREALVQLKIDRYSKTAAAEGGIAGAGGFLLALADLPVLLGIKFKLLFEIAALYGYSGSLLSERLYILQIFQLAFSSDQHRATVFQAMQDQAQDRSQLPPDLENFDWRAFQQQYRDYIDLAKLAQLLPVIGAPVGVYVNHRLLRKLGTTAINAYRMRWFDDIKTAPASSSAVVPATAP